MLAFTKYTHNNFILVKNKNKNIIQNNTEAKYLFILNTANTYYVFKLYKNKFVSKKLNKVHKIHPQYLE